jgi:hypothetical protein
MSFLADFVGGAAESGAGIIGSQIKSDQDQARQESLAKLNSELETERQKTISQLNNDLAISRQKAELQAQNANADTLRTQQTDRVNKAAQPIIQGMQLKKLNTLYGPDSNLQAGDADQSELDGVPLSADEQSQARIQAAGQTLDIPLATQAQLSQRSDAAYAALAQKGAHDDTLMAMNANRYDTQSQIAASANQTRELIASLKQGSKADKADASEKLTTQLNGITRIVGDMQANGDDKKNPTRFQSLQAMQDEILGTLKNKRSGLDAPDAPASTAASPTKRPPLSSFKK